MMHQGETRQKGHMHLPSMESKSPFYEEKRSFLRVIGWYVI
jgi:hypothetical protein